MQREALLPSSADCLLNDYPVVKAARTTSVPHLDLVTGSPELANADLALCDVAGRELALKNALLPAREQYEVTILDCPPSLSLVSVNALVAADFVLIPVSPQYLAIQGVVSLLAAVAQMRTRLKARATIMGILLMMADGSPQTSAAREQLRSIYGDLVMSTEIVAAPTFNEAPARGQTIVQFAPRTAAAEAFTSLSGEVLERARV